MQLALSSTQHGKRSSLFPKMEGEESSRAKPQRLLTLSEQFLRRRNLTACRKCALLALRSNPDLSEADQILAIAEVLTASAGDHPDLYAILQVEPPCDDTRVLRSHFKRLALLLNPAKNKFAFAQEAFDRVTYAWSVLSYPAKKTQYDAEAEQKQPPEQESPQRSSGKEETVPSDGGLGGGTFWTVCPYCYYVYEYDRFYEGCCLKCQACMRAFHGVAIAAPPPTIPGKDEYCCCFAYFPMGFTTPEGGGRGMGAGWPFSPMFPSRQAEEKEKDSLNVNSENVETGEGKKGAENMGMHEHEKRGERGEMPYFARPSARNKKTVASNTKKIMGKGVKKHETGRLNLNADAETESETEDGVPGIARGGGMESEDLAWVNCEFSDGDDDIFVSVVETS